MNSLNLGKIRVGVVSPDGKITPLDAGTLPDIKELGDLTGALPSSLEKAGRVVSMLSKGELSRLFLTKGGDKILTN